MKLSVNYQLLEARWVYPTFYPKLYFDLRAELADTALAARDAGRGVWEHDATLAGYRLTARTQLTDDLVLMTKLLRRLAEYVTLDDTGGVSLAGVKAFPTAHDDQLFTVPAGQATSFATVVDVRRQRLHLTLPPEQLVFIEA